MTETVQDVLQKMSEDAGITGPIRFNPKGLMTQGQFMDFVKDYTERFAQALTAEKGSKSTPLTEKQKNCPYCHEDKDWIADNDVIMHYGTDNNGLPILDINDHGHWITTDAICCQWCGRKLDGDD